MLFLSFLPFYSLCTEYSLGSISSDGLSAVIVLERNVHILRLLSLCANDCVVQYLTFVYLFFPQPMFYFSSTFYYFFFAWQRPYNS